MSNLSGTQLGPYRLMEHIGRGGMSDVYRAVRLPDQLEVAIKVLRSNADTDDEIFRKRFDQEAAIVRSLRHPNILPLYDYNHERGYTYLAMQLVRGGTLATILRQRRLSIEEAGGWLYQIGAALDHAHERGIVHRDLKPTNILLDGSGKAYLTDFGIAKLANITGSLTLTGNVLGTPTYMAPEQWRSEKLTAQTDVYGLGVLVYLMLTGKPPFESDTPHGMMYKHLNDAPPSMRDHVPDIPDLIDQVVLKALSKRARDRYPSTGEFSNDYQRALRGQETLAQRYPPSRLAKKARPDTGSAPAVPPKRITTEMPAVYTPPAASSSTPAISMPPPVYGPQHIYQPAAAPPPALSQLTPAQPFVPVFTDFVREEKSRQRDGRRVRLFALLLLIAGALSGGSYYLLTEDPFGLFKITETPISNRITVDLLLTPTPTSLPGEKPLARVDSPANGTNVTVGQGVVIQVTAEDSLEVSRIQVKRFGFILPQFTMLNETPSQTFTTEFTYVPRQAGRHVLEIVPYRGGIAGDAAILEILAE